MGYSHGYKNATFGKPHGVEEQMDYLPSRLQPEVFAWTRSGANWANANIFTGKDAAHGPEAAGWLTEEQAEVLFHKGPGKGLRDLESAENRGFLSKEDADDLLPYTWTMSGHLWAKEHEIFKGPPPSVRSWVTKKQMVQISHFNGDYKPESAENAAKMGIFRKEESAPNGSFNLKRAREARDKKARQLLLGKRSHNDMPTGWENHLEKRFFLNDHKQSDEQKA